MKLVFPDACWNRDLISGALLLYFHDEKVGLTLHPSVSTFMTGIDPFDFVRLVAARKPDWSAKFFALFKFRNIFQANLRATTTLLEPLRDVGFKSVLISYPKGSGAWESAEELLASSSLKPQQIVDVIDPFSASDELFSHIFFERYLELYEGHRTPEQLMALGAERSRNGVPEPVDVDWTALYAYCNERFHTSEIEELFATAYMFRLPMLKDAPAVLLSNPNLVEFLASLPLESKRDDAVAAAGIDSDVIAWEFFRQLISPHVDPLDEANVRKVVKLVESRTSEIDSLKKRCRTLAEDLVSEPDLAVLQKRIKEHIRAHVENEVQAVLSLDRAATREFLDLVFSDAKAWAGVATFLFSLIEGGPVLTAGAAIYALANLGSKAFKAAATKRQKLEVSNYALLYRMRQLS